MLHETSILATQTIVERMQSITSDVNAQSTTSTTPKKHNEIKTSTNTYQNRCTILAINKKVSLAKYLQTNLFNTKVKEESIPHEDSNAT